MQSLERQAQRGRSPLSPLTAIALGVIAALVLVNALSPAVFWVEKLYLVGLAVGLASCARMVWRGAPGSALWTAAALGADAAVAASADALTSGGVAIGLAVALAAALAERGPEPLPEAWWRGGALLAWAALCAFLVSGFPPSVDLPAHGAQMQTLVELLRGEPDLRALYRIQFPLGYGLPYWLFLPVAWLGSGALAMRAALWLALVAFPVSVSALLRAAGRPAPVPLLALCLPLAFNLSYWYGLVSGLFAQPLALFGLAAYLEALKDGRRRWVVLANLAGAACLLSHLVAFAVLAFLVGVAALASRPRGKAIRMGALSLGLPVALSLPKAIGMATRAVTPGDWPATFYGAEAHLNWFFKNYRPEGLLSIAGPLAIAAAFAGLWGWRWRRSEPDLRPVALFLAMSALYVASPKTLSGIYLIAMRLPVFAGALALLLVPWSAVPRVLRVGMLLVAVASLAETTAFHVRFKREVDGLQALIASGPRPGRHGYVPLNGTKVLGSHHIYAEHLGQWWTAERGGVGHHFFADAEHHPVAFQPGVTVPATLEDGKSRVGWFDELLVYGDGPLPEWLAGFDEVERAGANWRRLRRRPETPPAPGPSPGD
ncbi:MAG TPA: hypothetical protein VIG99_04685 [Myxococcaceae bacterium]